MSTQFIIKPGSNIISKEKMLKLFAEHSSIQVCMDSEDATPDYYPVSFDRGQNFVWFYFVNDQFESFDLYGSNNASLAKLFLANIGIAVELLPEEPIVANEYKSKAAQATEIIKSYGKNINRKEIIDRFINEVGLTPAGAVTYYSNICKKMFS